MKHSLAVILILLLTGCGLLPEVKDETAGWSAQKLYSKAKEKMDDGVYSDAIKYFETLEARYPYGRYAQQSQLEIAYAYYKDNEPASTIAACDRFIKLHPNHPNVDYVYYLKGLANFNEDLGLLGRVGLGDKDLSDRDPKAFHESFDAFKVLVDRFPNSKYSPDATARMKYLVNALASHEVHVARYYIKRGAYLAAVNRAQHAVQSYPQAPATEDALAIMVKGYDELGMKDLSADALRVLRKNFPTGTYFTQATAAQTPWWKLW
ncbi:MAG: outer membrane protein assembly factor BamD [Burkholderiales bacterium]|nr:outer membrane protein assembly factor BamD [Sulfuricellaceae bacterium]